jgi:hypothetical protein
MHPKSKSLRTRNLTDEERNMIVITKEVDAEIAPENPLNYDQQSAPHSLDFIDT